MSDRGPNRARVIQSADVFVDGGGLIYSADYNGGLTILEHGGAEPVIRADRFSSSGVISEDNTELCR